MMVADNLARVDGKLIDQVCQPLVDWIDEHLALDCFSLARGCTDLSALAWLLSQAPGAAAALKADAPGYQVFQCALILLGLGSIMVLRAQFARGAGKRMRTQANPLRAAMFTHRLGCLFWLAALSIKTSMGPIGFASLTLLAVGGFATMAVYVGACTNRPPKTRTRNVDDWGWRPAASR